MDNFQKSNIELSKLNNKNKFRLIKYISKTNYLYLDNINIPSNLHFGIEIEGEKGFKNTIKEAMKMEYNAIEVVPIYKNSYNDYTRWHISNDMSLDSGIELSSPIFNDKKETWLEIKNVCELLNRCKLIATSKTGAHIHFNVSFLGGNYKNFIKLLKLYTVYENILIKFGYGPSGIPRNNLEKFARPVGNRIYKILKIIENIETIEELKLWLYYDRHTSMNLKNIKWFDINNEVKNTIEFRSPNGTIDYIIWQNLINTYAHLLNAVVNGQIDEDLLNYKLKNYYLINRNNKEFYTKIYLKEAMEFSDIIFNNNYDKIMFLKQYLNLDNLNINFKDKQNIIKKINIDNNPHI